MLKLTEEAEEARPEERGKGETPQADGGVASHQRMAVSLGLKGGSVRIWHTNVSDSTTGMTVLSRLTDAQVAHELMLLLFEGAAFAFVDLGTITASIGDRIYIFHATS